MKTWWMGLAACALVLAPCAATAGNDTQPAMRASMVLTGSIVIKPDGGVASFTLDHADKVAAGAKAELAKVVPQWKFEPVMRDGKAVQAKSPMSVRLVANPAGNGKYAIYAIAVSGAYFGGSGKASVATTLRYAVGHPRRAPRYPRWAARQGVSGVVYLLARVGRDGTIHRLAVQQINMFVTGAPSQLKQWRETLADAATHAVKHWTFDIPTEGPSAKRDNWYARIPIVFRLRGAGRYVPKYGQWHSYLPGPKQYIPWAEKHMVAKGSTDAIPAGGGLYSAEQTLHLLSSLSGS